MAKSENDSRHTLNIGKERLKRISSYRAKQQLKGVKLSSIEKAVNYIIDKVIPE